MQALTSQGAGSQRLDGRHAFNNKVSTTQYLHFIDDHSFSFDNISSTGHGLHEEISNNYFLCVGWLWVSQEMQMNKLSKLQDMKSRVDLQLHKRNLIQENKRLKYKLNQKRFLYSTRSFLVYLWMRVKPKLPVWAQIISLKIIRLLKI